MFSKFKSDLTITTSVVAVALMAISVSAAELEVIDTTQVVNPETFNAVDVLLNNGTLQFTADGRISPRDIALEGAGGVFNTGANNVTINSNIIGAGDLTKSGSGTLTLWGMNSYTGETNIAAGTLALAQQGRINGSTLVTISTGATLDVSAVGLAHIKEISGAGSIVLGDGSISIGGGTFAGVISGSGGVDAAAGTLILTGENTFTGQASSGLGILQVGNGGTTGTVIGNILNTNKVVFNRSDAVTYAGAITGSGNTTFTGGGNYTLTTTSSASGTVNIDAGTTLQWGNGGAAGWIGGDPRLASVGPITNNGTFVINRSSNRLYQGVITGTGSFTKQGTGAIALSNTSTYTGATNVEAGTLHVSGSIGQSSLTSVFSGANLTGTGTVGATTILSGGMLSPGGSVTTPSGGYVLASSIGTLNTGNLTMSGGSVFQVKVDDQGASDKVNVTGTAALDPLSIVRVTALNGTDDGSSYGPNTTYTILSATGGISGAFNSAVDEQFAFLDAKLQYVGNDVLLALSRNDIDIPDVANTPNQQAAASSLAGFDQDDPVYQQLLGLTTEQAQEAYASVSGEIHASGQQVIEQTFNMFQSSMAGGLKSGTTPGRQVAPLGYVEVPTSSVPGLAAIADLEQTAIMTNTMWLTPMGGLGTIKGDGNAAQLNWAAGGLSAGYDVLVQAGDHSLNYGAALGYIASRGEVAARSSDYETQGGLLGAYGGWSDGAFSLSGNLSYGLANVSTSRDIEVGAINRTAKANYWSSVLGGGLEAGYGFALTDAFTLRPLGTLDVAWTGHNGATETGAGSLNGTIAAADHWKVDTGVGVELRHETTMANGDELILNARALWQHSLGDVIPSQSLALAGNTGTEFAVSGAEGSRDRAVVGLGMDWKPQTDMRFSLNYGGAFSSTETTHVLGASFGQEF